MSPISTALPASVIETLDTIFANNAATPVGSFPGQSLTNLPGIRTRNQVFLFGQPYSATGFFSGSGSTTAIAAEDGGAPGGVFCTKIVSTASAVGAGYQPPMAHPSWGPAAGWNPGALQSPGAVVCTYGVMWALEADADSFPDDTSGFFFIPSPAGVTPNYVASTRVGSTPQNGFGMFFNTNGAGGIQVDYLAWDQAAVTERVADVGAGGIITDVTQWNFTQFVVVSASSGRECQITMSVNGTEVVSAREIGTDIVFPDENIDSLSYNFGYAQSTGGGAGIFFSLYGWNGRFSPDGSELQPFG